MVLQETETQVQTALSDTILTTFQKTIKYQTEFSVEGLIRVVVDKKDIYTFNINERIEKGKEVERLLSASSDSKSPTKRKRGRPRKSQKLAESESDEDAFDDFPGEQEDDDEEDLDDSGAKVGDEKTDEQNIVKQEPLGFDMAGGDGSQKQAEAGSQVFSQEDTALQLQQLALQLAGVSSDLAMQQPEIPASSAATPGTATDPSQPDVWSKLAEKTSANSSRPNKRKRGRPRKHEKRQPAYVRGIKKKDVQCPVCNKTFKGMGFLRVHIKRHEKRPMLCRYCDKTFERSCDFQRHERSHTGEKPFQCAYCGKRFSQEGSCKMHEKIHTNDKKYKCGYCDMRFIRENQCVKHERTHTGEKPYICSYCGRKFALDHHLKRHERMHTGEKPYQCSFCSMRFFRDEHLKEHERTHTKEMNFKCKYCGKRFNLKRTLKSHEKAHRKEGESVKEVRHRSSREIGEEAQTVVKPEDRSRPYLNRELEEHVTRELAEHALVKAYVQQQEVQTNMASPSSSSQPHSQLSSPAPQPSHSSHLRSPQPGHAHHDLHLVSSNSHSAPPHTKTPQSAPVNPQQQEHQASTTHSTCLPQSDGEVSASSHIAAHLPSPTASPAAYAHEGYYLTPEQHMHMQMHLLHKY